MALCVLLSLLLHAGLAWALCLLPRDSGSRQKERPSTQTARHVQVVRAKPRRKTPAAQAALQSQQAQAPFAKTSADEQNHRPENADFVGSRDSVASGGPDAPQRQSDAPMPTMTGRESEEEIVTFDQQRQDGELAHEGKAAEVPPSPATASVASPTAQPAQPAALGRAEGSSTTSAPEGTGAEPAQAAADATAALSPAPTTPGEGMKLAESANPPPVAANEQPPPAPLGVEDGNMGAPMPRPSLARVAAYDPSLAAHAQQPGMRTYERRTRSTGRFVFGRRPALNVASTARGRYEAEIYRRIARMWYAACDEHRGDIIPGTITVSLRLTKNGRIDSMDLVRRRGASMLQQSFSFAAIRRAALPPMPQEVQQEVIGKLYEMILTFNFD